MDIDIIIEDARWATLGLDDLCGRSIAALCQHMGIESDALEMTVLGCDDVRIAVLNSEFRAKAQPTNVLSWPAEDLEPPALPSPDFDGTVALGDIALAYDTCAREAGEQGKQVTDHVTHLIVHGTLHLLGYDHIRDIDATVMERLETEILGKMGLPDPY